MRLDLGGATARGGPTLLRDEGACDPAVTERMEHVSIGVASHCCHSSPEPLDDIGLEQESPGAVNIGELEDMVVEVVAGYPQHVTKVPQSCNRAER